MSWYFTVNGVPACRAVETLGLRTQCAHTSEEEARLDVSLVRAKFPDVVFEVIEGRCPAYACDESFEADRREAEDERYSEGDN